MISIPGESMVQGPVWCDNGLDVRGGRYPLSVEGPVLAAVGVLVPGVSSQSTLARWYALYWALAAFAADRDLDAETCRLALRRTEVALALAFDSYGGVPRSNSPMPHALDQVRSRRDKGDPRDLDVSYSPRHWGFWEQYNGPSTALGTVTLTDRGLRPGRHPCPPTVAKLFAPVFDIALTRPVTDTDTDVALMFDPHTAPEIESLRNILCANTGAAEQSPDDRTRRATVRALARAFQLHPTGGTDSVRALTEAVAFGPLATTDTVLGESDCALEWRGVLLRHYSVGAWRRLWAQVVAQVRQSGLATRADLHDWITTEIGRPAPTVADLVAELPVCGRRRSPPAR